jgi:hypothetical protein
MVGGYKVIDGGWIFYDIILNFITLQNHIQKKSNQINLFNSATLK